MEHLFELGGHQAGAFFGPNDQHLRMLETHFPKLKMLARGNTLLVKGEAPEVETFISKYEALVAFLDAHNGISPQDVERILLENANEVPEQPLGQSDLILFGTNGMAIKARTTNQRKLVQAVLASDLVFALGPAGTGKTYTAVALAVRALKNKEVKRIVLTRPAVEAGENLGFLPGDLREKLDPYLQPLYDALRDMLPGEKLNQYLENGTIQIAPLAFMRGRTLDHAFVILDEAQNATESQMKMFLTRMGSSAKFVITGDVTQVDLPARQRSGLIQASHLLKEIPAVRFVELDAGDVIRHRLVKAIIQAYERKAKTEE
jgi:phosphate starvation-inducible PhoH-like protein